MRDIDPRQRRIWEGGLYVGANRPMQRVTVAKEIVQHPSTARGRWSSALFNQPGRPMELTSVKSVSINRQIGQDAATCTIEIINVANPVAAGGSFGAELELPGWYTPNRGQDEGNRWNRDKNEWADMLVPNRMIRTYWGYGWDRTKTPDNDPSMVPSGVWLIDKVTLRDDRVIVIECRDLAKILIEQIAFPPVVPLKDYPLKWRSRQTLTEIAAAKSAAAPTGTTKPVIPPGTPSSTIKTVNRIRGTYSKSSNDVYVGVGKAVHGHFPRQAFDADDATYWLSIGNPTRSSDTSIEYVECSVPNISIAGVVFKPWRGHYKVWLSVFANGAWINHGQIPYNRNSPTAFQPGGNGADIPWAEQKTTGTHDVEYEIRTRAIIHKATRVRLTFTDLANSGISPVWRAGVRDFEVLQEVNTTTPAVPPRTAYPGGVDTPSLGAGTDPVLENTIYQDYTDIVKYLCAIGGFFWPKSSTRWKQNEEVPYTPSNPDDAHYKEERVLYARDDPQFGQGRVWGDFEFTGTYGPKDLPVGTFDKRPLLDGITYVKDILGFIFCVDETGGAIFRSPNIWRVGNYVTPASGASVPGSPALSIPGVENAPAPAETAARAPKILRDFFARANDTNIRQAETGQKWRQFGRAFNAGTAFGVDNQRAIRKGGPNNNVGLDLWATAEHAKDTDFVVSVKMREATAARNYARLLVRANVVNCVHITVHRGEGAIRVGTFVSAVYTPTAEAAVVIPETATIRVRMVKDEIRIYVNGTKVLEHVDRRYSNPSFGVGVGFRNDWQNIAFDSVNAVEVIETTTAVDIDGQGISSNSPTGMQVSTTSKIESFAVADQPDLRYVGSLPWVRISDAGAKFTGTISIANQRAVLTSSNVRAGEVINVNDPDVTLSIVVRDDEGNKAGLLIRADTADGSAYLVSSKGVRAITANGTIVSLGDYNTGDSDGLEHKLTAKVIGSYMEVYLDGQLQQTVTGMGLNAASGKHGIYFGLGLNGGSTGGAYIDDFQIDSKVTVGEEAAGDTVTRSGRGTYYIDEEVLVIDERKVLKNITVTLNDQNQRSAVFVGNGAGTLGAVSSGFEAYPAGLERVAIWTDQNFEKVSECQVMADLIGVRIIFAFRTNQITIPGCPAFQIDDQVRVYERNTGESFIHYINGIQSTWDAASGEWLMTLSTHWLGEKPFEKWAFDPAQLAQVTQDFLNAIGKVTK